MKIAFFTDTFFPQINGVTNTYGQLSKYLNEKKIEHLFFAPDYNDDQSQDCEFPVIRFKGITPKIYPECKLAFPSYGKVLEILLDFQPDLVHIATELGIGFCGLRAARELGLPIVMSYHTSFDIYLDYYHLRYLNKPLWSYMKWFHQFADVNFCPSLHTLHGLSMQGFANLNVWARGIDLHRFNPDHYSAATRSALGGQDHTVFLYVGRMAREKGLDTFVKGIERINKIHQKEITFVFTGDGPYLHDLMALNIPNMIFTGAKRGDELSQIYASCDVFVFPSGTETFGNVMLEAMASGLPGICVNRGGVTDFTVHRENALVCNDNDPESLAAAMEQLLDPALRQVIRQGALRTAKEKSWNSIFDQLMMHYKTTVEKSFHPMPGRIAG